MTSSSYLINKQISEKRSKVGTHRNAAYCLLKNMSTKHSKYVVNQSSILMMTFRELVGRIRMGFIL
jgi:hypothetical protein